jgi:hypothetical protein
MDFVRMHSGAFDRREAVNPSPRAALSPPCGTRPRVEPAAGVLVNTGGSVEQLPLAWPVSTVPSGIRCLSRYRFGFACRGRHALRYAHQLSQYRGGVSAGAEGKPDLQGVVLPLPLEVFDRQPQRAAVGVQSHPGQSLYPG